MTREDARLEIRNTQVFVHIDREKVLSCVCIGGDEKAEGLTADMIT
jgi:hypothetical protein